MVSILFDLNPECLYTHNIVLNLNLLWPKFAIKSCQIGMQNQ